MYTACTKNKKVYKHVHTSSTSTMWSLCTATSKQLLRFYHVRARHISSWLGVELYTIHWKTWRSGNGRATKLTAAPRAFSFAKSPRYLDSQNQRTQNPSNPEYFLIYCCDSDPSPSRAHATTGDWSVRNIPFKYYPGNFKIWNLNYNEIYIREKNHDEAISIHNIYHNILSDALASQVAWLQGHSSGVHPIWSAILWYSHG